MGVCDALLDLYSRKSSNYIVTSPSFTSLRRPQEVDAMMELSGFGTDGIQYRQVVVSTW